MNERARKQNILQRLRLAEILGSRFTAAMDSQDGDEETLEGPWHCEGLIELIHWLQKVYPRD